MAATFEDRLARLATEGPAAAAPRPVRMNNESSIAQSMRGETEESFGLKTLAACFAGGFLGLILATIASIGMVEGSPWGPGSALSDAVMLPTLGVSLLLIFALIPTTIFFRRAPKSFAFVSSALVVLMIGFLI